MSERGTQRDAGRSPRSSATPGRDPAGGVSRPPHPTDAELRRETSRAVVRLGSPIVAANLLTWAVGFTDIFMVSRLGEAALAGLGMANQVFFLVVIFTLAVSTGTMTLVARAVGAHDMPAASHVLRQSLLLSLVLALAMTVVGYAVSPLLLRVLGATDAVAAAGTLYLRVLFLGVAAPMLDFTLANTFRGAGDSMTPLRITAGVVVLNIALNYLLIFGPGPLPAWGIGGAAAATVLARGCGAWWAWRRVRAGTGALYLVPGSWRPDGEVIRRVLRIGIPSALEGFMRAGSGVAFLGIIARTGPGATAVAAHTVGLQLESFARMPAFAVSQAATSLVGQRLGADDPEGAERAGWASVRVGLVLLCALAALLFVLARPVAGLFSDQEQTIRLATHYLRILAAAQPLFLVAVAATGALRGGGDTRFPMWVSFLSGWLFLLPLAYGLAVGLGLGPEAAWAAQAGNYALSALLVALRFRGGRWKTMPV